MIAALLGCAACPATALACSATAPTSSPRGNGNVISTNAGTAISHDGASAISHDGATAIPVADNSILSEHGAGPLTEGGLG